MCDALSSKDGLFISSHMERTVLCPSTGPGPLLNYTPWIRQSWEGVPAIPVVRPAPLHLTQHPFLSSGTRPL